MNNGRRKPMKKTERIMHRAPRSAARASRARTAMCVMYLKCVYCLFCVPYTHLFYIYQWLTAMCVMCVLCVAVSKFILGLVSNTVLFLKTNINLKTLYTHYTHLYSPRVSSLYTLKNSTHMCTHIVHTWGSSVHTSRI